MAGEWLEHLPSAPHSAPHQLSLPLLTSQAALPLRGKAQCLFVGTSYQAEAGFGSVEALPC